MGIRRPYQAKDPIEWAKDHDLAYKTWITRHSDLIFFLRFSLHIYSSNPIWGGRKRK
jgi:hypothetical protein